MTALCHNFRPLGQVLHELDSSSATERSSPVILSAAKHLAADRGRPFAALRVTRGDGSNCHVPFVHLEPCLTIQTSPRSAPSTWPWFGEVTIIAHYLLGLIRK